MELYPNGYRIQPVFRGRNRFQYLFVGVNVVVVDTAFATTPQKIVFPYLHHLALAPGAKGPRRTRQRIPVRGCLS